MLENHSQSLEYSKIKIIVMLENKQAFDVDINIEPTR